MDSPLKSTFSLSPHSGVELLPGGTVSDLEYVDDVVLLSEDPGSLQDLLCSLYKSAAMFGIPFCTSKVQNDSTRLARGDTELVDYRTTVFSVSLVRRTQK